MSLDTELTSRHYASMALEALKGIKTINQIAQEEA